MSETINIIEEEDHVEFSKYEQLSYKDNEGENVELYVDDKKEGSIKVFLDSEMNNREYVCINYEIVYLDSITKK